MKLDSPIFQDGEAARIHLEAQRWPYGPNCPHCGNARPDRITKMEGKAHRPGLYNCMECREQFTVTVGTVFERSKIALNKWLLATFLMASSKKGMSAHQLHRMLGVTYKTAWFMAHRIREAMAEDVKSSGPLGGEGKTVEADETYIGRVDRDYLSPQRKGQPRLKRKMKPKRTVIGLVERGGKARMVHVQHATKAVVRDILVRNADRNSTLYTDQSKLYTTTGEEYASHKTTNHSAGEYVRYEDGESIHSNTIENVFSVFKRGMTGVYQHCGEAHLHRYLAEFDFRYNRRAALNFTDTERHDQLLAKIEGKRLTYRRTGEAGLA
ncbi:IS1595 family transposase [Mesorhizobium sp. M4A.F.Ca.ET.050.02.1.1]|uniref:IS1595 family transposase n=1 Tax=Mesorhizobium sp. M4A.F.Ca.ET.050.02.1.1 TaxID=2496754 RepID=UPI000FCAF77D|nr:IS1595 family transposase [Mesorhizobium sp. M4A.F.Ca.ET.050.02.1.1]RUX48079.1 IS1595 family transposase [Mesorhizobium sp. M4A.F.Ca.ET.050.02.1.1]